MKPWCCQRLNEAVIGVRRKINVGVRCGGGTHKADAMARLGTDEILVSLKWQQTGGTAEQKVPFEVMCLADAVRAGNATRAYLVLGGDGWSLRVTTRLAHWPTT